jgi:hypothetical protein
MRLTAVAGAILVGATAAILVATLRPDFSREAQDWTNCIVCGERGTADALVNSILFAPLGIGLRLAGLRIRRALLLGALFSALVELAQTVIPGRDPSLGDVLFNTVGTAVGFGLAAGAPRLGQLPDGMAGRLSLAFAMLSALVVAGTGILLQPSLPRTAYYGQWTPNLGHLEWYRGRVSRVQIAGIAVPSHRIADSRAIRGALLQGKPIEVTAIAGPAVPALASLFSIYDESRRQMLLLGPDRDDLVFRYRTRAAAWRLDQPDLRLTGGMRGLAPGDRLDVRAWSPEAGNRCLLSSVRQACGLGFTVGSAWGLLYYAEHVPPWLKGTLNCLWAAVLLLPVGAFLRARWESAAATGLAAAALLWLPAAVGLRPTTPVEWAGAIIALAAGQLTYRAWGAPRRLHNHARRVPSSRR